MKAARPTVSELEKDKGFELIAEIPHNAVHTWVQRYLFSPNWIIAAYWTVNLIALLILLAVWRASGIGLMDAFAIASLGMVCGYLVLLPVHEHCHGIAYRATGASNVRVCYDGRRLTAFCVAPGHVLSSAESLTVCLAPAVLLNPTLAVLTLLAPPGKTALIFAGALLLHIGACSGDIAFVSYLWTHRGQPLFTFDDALQPRTMFYRKKTIP
jgi:hypothetical protein